MEVPFSRNPPNLQVVPQIDPRYADMAIGEAYSAYNAKALFADTEISKNLEDMRDQPEMTKLTAMFDRMHSIITAKEGSTPRPGRGDLPDLSDTTPRGQESKTQTPDQALRAVHMELDDSGQTPR